MKSVHFEVWPELPAEWADRASAMVSHSRFPSSCAMGAIEKLRAEGVVKSSLQAHPTLYAPQAVIDAFAGPVVEDIFITSSATLVVGTPPQDATLAEDDEMIGVTVAIAEGKKCHVVGKFLRSQ